jgi:hypothetical protein
MFPDGGRSRIAKFGEGVRKRSMRKPGVVAVRVVVAASSAVLVAGLTGCGSGSGAHIPSVAAVFHHVNWGTVTLPGSICRGSRPVHLRDGSAVARATRPSDGVWHTWPRIYLSEVGPHPTYGTLGGRPAAALDVGCDNGGQTADGYMAYAQVIFVARHDAAPVLAGIVKPHIRPWGSGGPRLASLLTVMFHGNEVIAHEAFYGGSDGTCCPSGRATTVWRHSGGRLRRVRTTVTRRPRWLS